MATKDEAGERKPANLQVTTYRVHWQTPNGVTGSCTMGVKTGLSQEEAQRWADWLNSHTTMGTRHWIEPGKAEA